MHVTASGLIEPTSGAFNAQFEWYRGLYFPSQSFFEAVFLFIGKNTLHYYGGISND